MAIQHAVITDPDIHEPKGAAAATTGQVYVASGSGSGAFSDTISNCHGQMEIINNTVAKTLVAAADTTLNTNAQYSKLTGASAPWASSFAHLVTFNTDSLTAPKAGYYLLSFWSSVLIASNNNFIGIKFGVNDVLSTQKIVTQSSTASDRRNMSATSIIGPVPLGGEVSIWVAGTIGTAITMQDAGMMLAYLHA